MKDARHNWMSTANQRKSRLYSLVRAGKASYWMPYRTLDKALEGLP